VEEWGGFLIEISREYCPRTKERGDGRMVGTQKEKGQSPEKNVLEGEPLASAEGQDQKKKRLPSTLGYSANSVKGQSQGECQRRE